MSEKLKKLIKKWEDSGRIATIYPKLKRISLNGFKSIDFETAQIQLEEFVKENVK